MRNPVAYSARLRQRRTREAWGNVLHAACSPASIGMLGAAAACAAALAYGIAETAPHAEPVNGPISLACGAYDVTYQAHDVASRDDVFRAMPQGCTLIANPDFRAGVR